MKVFVLIEERDTDVSGFTTTVDLFLDSALAQDTMQKQYAGVLEEWEIDPEQDSESQGGEINEGSAWVKDYEDSVRWRIAEKELSIFGGFAV